MKPVIAALALASLASACASMPGAESPPASPPPVAPPIALGPAKTVTIQASGGAPIGSATFTDAPGGVLIRIAIEAGKLPPGWHGAHFHEKADCSDAAFQLSGAHAGHLTPPSTHGLLNPAGPEPGDLPNLYVAAPGGAAEFYSPLITLYERPDSKLLALTDADGSALVIHAGPDDHSTQPIGGAGARIACAAITK